jgi:hypothetical protein
MGLGCLWVGWGRWCECGEDSGVVVVGVLWMGWGFVTWVFVDLRISIEVVAFDNFSTCV